MRPADIYDQMIGKDDETQMTGLRSHRPLLIPRHATATWTMRCWEPLRLRDVAASAGEEE